MGTNGRRKRRRRRRDIDDIIDNIDNTGIMNYQFIYVSFFSVPDRRNTKDTIPIRKECVL